MIVLSVLLWVQAGLLALIAGVGIYQGGKNPSTKASTVGATGAIFGSFIGVTVISALVIGGLA